MTTRHPYRPRRTGDRQLAATVTALQHRPDRVPRQRARPSPHSARRWRASSTACWPCCRRRTTSRRPGWSTDFFGGAYPGLARHQLILAVDIGLQVILREACHSGNASQRDPLQQPLVDELPGPWAENLLDRVRDELRAAVLEGTIPSLLSVDHRDVHERQALSWMMAMQCKAQSKLSGERCKRWVTPGRDVCRFHGGKVPRGPALPQFRHGRYSRFLPSRLAATYQTAAKDPELLSLRHEFALVDARSTIYFSVLIRGKAGRSGPRWGRSGRPSADRESLSAGEGARTWPHIKVSGQVCLIRSDTA
jgi:hypothetical protein